MLRGGRWSNIPAALAAAAFLFFPAVAAQEDPPTSQGETPRPPIEPIVAIFDPQPSDAAYQQERDAGVEWIRRVSETAISLNHPRLDWALHKFKSRPTDPRILAPLFVATSLTSSNATTRPLELFDAVAIEPEVPTRPGAIQLTRFFVADSARQPYNNPRQVYASLRLLLSMNLQQEYENAALNMWSRLDPPDIVASLQATRDMLYTIAMEDTINTYRDLKYRDPYSFWDTVLYDAELRQRENFVFFSDQPDNELYGRERAQCMRKIDMYLASLLRMSHPRFRWAADKFVSVNTGRVLSSNEVVPLFVTSSEAYSDPLRFPSRIYHPIALLVSTTARADLVQYSLYCVAAAAAQPYNEPDEAYPYVQFLYYMLELERHQSIRAARMGESSEGIVAFFRDPQTRAEMATSAAGEALAAYREVRGSLTNLGIRDSIPIYEDLLVDLPGRR